MAQQAKPGALTASPVHNPGEPCSGANGIGPMVDGPPAPPRFRHAPSDVGTPTRVQRAGWERTRQLRSPHLVWWLPAPAAPPGRAPARALPQMLTMVAAQKNQTTSTCEDSYTVAYVTHEPLLAVEWTIQGPPVTNCGCNSTSGDESTPIKGRDFGSSIVDFANPNEIIDSFPLNPRKITIQNEGEPDVVSAPSIGVLAGTYRLYVGQFKISEIRGCWKHVADERGCYYDVHLTVRYPTVADYAEAVRNCMVGCGAGTLLAAYVTGGAVLAAAKEAFIGCTKVCLLVAIGEVANQFSLSLDSDFVRCSKWSNHR